MGPILFLQTSHIQNKTLTGSPNRMARRRQLTVTLDQTSLSSNNTPTDITSSSQKSFQPKDLPTTGIWLSVFIGRPDEGGFDHARFNARVPQELWLNDNAFMTKPDSKALGSISWNQSTHLRFPEVRLPILHAAGKVGVAFTEEVLVVHDGPCVICRTKKARFTMCRPVAATRRGYFDLPDAARMYRFMATLASHTGHFTSRREVDWSVGSFFTDRPYMCCIAVPVCSTDDYCYRSALSCTQSYIMGILDVNVKPRPLQDMFVKTDTTKTTYRLRVSRGLAMSSGHRSLVRRTPTTAVFPVNNVDRKLLTIGTTVFIGRPELQLADRGQNQQLSCLVLSSTWPAYLLPSQMKNEADEAYDYCRVAAYHESHILETADYRCAICPQAVPARSLLHRPILVSRTGRRPLQDSSLRGSLTRLAQYVKSHWNHPEMELFFGGASDAHIWDYAVPICETGTICEEVARTAAREFTKLFLPSDMPVLYSGLDPDTDLSLLEFDDDDDYDSDDSDWEQENPELWVKKIAPRALVTYRGDWGEDAADCVLTVTKLRHWFELCFEEEVSKREYLRQIGYKRAGDVSDSDSDGENDIDEPVVWVYARDNDEEGGSTSPEEDQLQQSVVERLENRFLFEPTLSFDFWLLCEAVGRVPRN